MSIASFCHAAGDHRGSLRFHQLFRWAFRALYPTRLELDTPKMIPSLHRQTGVMQAYLYVQEIWVESVQSQAGKADTWL